MATEMTRREARESAIKLLFGYNFNGEESAEAFYALAVEEYELPVNDFVHDLFFGVCAHALELDEKIAAKASGWNFSRLARMTLTILRLCSYELLFTDVPKEIAINEAIELAKSYDSDTAPAFVNGVLNTIAKEKEV